MKPTTESPRPAFTPYAPERVDDPESLRLAREFRAHMEGRRTVRMFSRKPVPREIIEEILITAGTAPSGAHKQPWTFVAISDDALKHRIRDAAEEEEKRFYSGVAPEEWLNDLAPLGTDWEKTHLTDAPWTIIVFAQDYAMKADGSKGKHYYVNESVGIAVGFLLAAVRRAGLVALTHTPSPMRFLANVLDRPKNERAYVVIPIGRPAEGCEVPALARKSPDEFIAWR